MEILVISAVILFVYLILRKLVDKVDDSSSISDNFYRQHINQHLNGIICTKLSTFPFGVVSSGDDGEGSMMLVEARVYLDGEEKIYNVIVGNEDVIQQGVDSLIRDIKKDIELCKITC